MIFLQLKKCSKKTVETEIFEADQTNLMKILDNQKKSSIEINLSDDDLESVNDDVGERINLEKIFEEVKLFEHNKKGSFQEVIIADKVDNDLNVDTLDVVDISKYIKDNN